MKIITFSKKQSKNADKNHMGNASINGMAYIIIPHDRSNRRSRNQSNPTQINTSATDSNQLKSRQEAIQLGGGQSISA